jgi:hypothetical protein
VGGLLFGLLLGLVFDRLAYPQRAEGLDPTYAAHISTVRAGPTATPALPLILSGSGAHTEPAVNATHAGPGRFAIAVTVATSPGRVERELLDTSGPWDGSLPLDTRDLGRITAITVIADGAWALRLSQED